VLKGNVYTCVFVWGGGVCPRHSSNFISSITLISGAVSPSATPQQQAGAGATKRKNKDHQHGGDEKRAKNSRKTEEEEAEEEGKGKEDEGYTSISSVDRSEDKSQHTSDQDDESSDK
jgi:Ni/Co efflux regulator RcnB